MRKLTLAAGILLASLFTMNKVSAQDEGQLMIVGGADVYKTNFSKPFGKAQLGFMFNFFIANKVALGAGVDYYTSGGTYLPIGPRLYPFGKFFLKGVPMIPLKRQGFEVDLGLGYDVMISDTWAIELSGSYYPIKQKAAAFRLGLAGFF